MICCAFYCFDGSAHETQDLYWSRRRAVRLVYVGRIVFKSPCALVIVGDYNQERERAREFLELRVEGVVRT